MKKTDTYLDDLFASARSEKPVLSEESARELLRTSERMQPSPFIFSTKGIIMTTIGLGLAALTAFIALSGSPQPSVSTLPQSPVSKNTAMSSPLSTLPAQPAAQVTEEPKKSDKKIVMKLVVIKTPVKVAGITPIALAPEKYAIMGLSKNNDGTVSFAQKNENGHVFTMSFPQNSWGIVINEDKNVPNAPTFAPLIVTDTKGNKRLMQFSSDENGMKMRGLQISSHSEDNEIDPEKLNELVSNAIKIENLQIGGKDGDVDLLKLGLDSNQIKELQDAIKLGAEINHDGDNANGSPKMQIHININSDKNEIDTSANGKPKKVFIKMNKEIRIDSTLRIAGDAVKRAEKEIQEVISKLHLEKIDSLNVNIKKLQMGGEDIDDNGEDQGITLSNIEKHLSKLDNLVPILVRTATSEHFDKAEGITYDDGLIFWYSPEKELIANIPEAAPMQSSVPPVSNTINSIITKVALFPNPAIAKTTVHIALAEPRTLAFSIHDLLGKRVLDGGSLAETSAGSFEHELNLSELTAGVYLLVITTDKGEQVMQRLVIEK